MLQFLLCSVQQKSPSASAHANWATTTSCSWATAAARYTLWTFFIKSIHHTIYQQNIHRFSSYKRINDNVVCPVQSCRGDEVVDGLHSASPRPRTQLSHRQMMPPVTHDLPERLRPDVTITVTDVDTPVTSNLMATTHILLCRAATWRYTRHVQYDCNITYINYYGGHDSNILINV